MLQIDSLRPCEYRFWIPASAWHIPPVPGFVVSTGLELLASEWRPVRDRDHTGVDRIPDSHAAAERRR
jgi:hypothetical protein